MGSAFDVGGQISKVARPAGGLDFLRVWNTGSLLNETDPNNKHWQNDY